MAVTPQSLLEAAQTLGRGEAEVDWRNAASRVYYAAYHRWRRGCNETPVGGSMGNGVIFAAR